MSLAQQIAARMLGGAKKSVMGSVKSGAAGAPAAETGSKSERASGTQPRHLPTRALELVPPGFIRERNAEKRADLIQPVPMAERRQRIAAGHARRNEPEPARPVSTQLKPAQPVSLAPVVLSGPRAITERPPPLPPRPPRAELDVDLVKSLEALPLPAAPAASSAAPARGRGSCFAIDAETGRQCRLPAHPEDPDRHRHERGPFFRLLQPGQAPRLHEQLDSAAMASTEAREVFAGHGHANPAGERKTRKDAGQRKSAHAGDSTSTGIKSIDTTPEASP